MVTTAVVDGVVTTIKTVIRYLLCLKRGAIILIAIMGLAMVVCSCRLMWQTLHTG